MGDPGLTTKFFRSLGHPTRVAIIKLLAKGDKSVSALTAATGVPQGRLSSHLALLRAAGLVVRRPVGRYRLYRVADWRVLSVLMLARELIRARAAYIPMCQCTQNKSSRRLKVWHLRSSA